MPLPDIRRFLLALCLVTGTIVAIAGCNPGAGAPTAEPVAAPAATAAPAGAPVASPAPGASAAPYAPKPGYNY